MGEVAIEPPTTPNIQTSLPSCIQHRWYTFNTLLSYMPLFPLFPPSSGMLRSRLRGHASKALVGLGRHLSRGGKAVIDSAQLLQALQTFHISIAQEVHSEEATVWYDLGYEFSINLVSKPI